MTNTNQGKDIRWGTPSEKSMAFRLFKQHITQLNNSYWANFPVATTIKKLIKKETEKNKNLNPIDYFIVQDEHDRRLASDFQSWEESYGRFNRDVRMNMVMSISSCFEVYFRSIVALSIESSPGIMFHAKNAIDGASLLKRQSDYSNFNAKKYPFQQAVFSVTKGNWGKRKSCYEKLFEESPDFLIKNSNQLEDLRKSRNRIGHYFGRTEEKYSVPTQFVTEEPNGTSHHQLIKFLELTEKTAEAIDQHLFSEFIGAYELLKFYFISLPQKLKNKELYCRAQWLQEEMAKHLPSKGTQYYKDLLSYFDSI